MERQLGKSLNSPFSVLAIIFAVAFPDFFLAVRDVCSNLRCFLQSVLRLLYTEHHAPLVSVGGKNPDLKGPHGQIFPAKESRVGLISDGELPFDEVKLSGAEAKLVMERLGIFCNPAGDDGFREELGTDQIAGLFDDQEPSLEEVKEAFHVFDTNRDGFIDARELRSFLCTFGFSQISEDDCRGMIRAFDENGDSLIDLREFTKLIEKSLH